MPLLHGELEVEVVKGENLCDKDNTLFHIIRGDWSDCWVTLSLGGSVILTTGERRNAIKAVWGERKTLPICHEAESLEVTVWDKDHFKSDLVGKGRVMLGDRDKAWNKDGPVYLEDGKGRIDLKVRYTPAEQATNERMEVPRAYFSMKEGGSLTLYQDAHTNELLGIKGITRGAFQDMAEAFRRAKRFIYIAGWSVWVGTRLERDSSETVGELLKKKAAEGVRVLLMIWNEKFSAGFCAGLVGTYDSHTCRYFKGSDVHVEMVRRHESMAHVIREQLVEALWTHHQKLVIADDGNNENTGLVAFVGGLDITGGRWDTPEHELYTTLKNEHHEDFYNGFIKVSPKQGPREPWHDIHGRVTGPAAFDLLRNFEERWRKQAPKKVHLLVKALQEDFNFAVTDNSQNGKWQMQVVRSIDSESVLFNSDRTGVLDFEDGKDTDRSLHRSIVRLIRRAQHFLYIETQYFIGSSQNWEEDQHLARNLIPLEIIQKVESKIRKGEDFRVYLVIPMIPEGNPDSKIACSSMRAIMRWQYLTIKMMYKRIAAVLQEMGRDNSPSDYLLILCLGKKESRSKVRSSSVPDPPKPGSDAQRWRELSRFLIYVHSKMILADDSHIIMGSANLNQRSLDGQRDTELAVSACQVTKEGVAVRSGEIAAFRRRLWAEHTSGISEEDQDLFDPASLTAIRKMRQLADAALKNYVDSTLDQEQRCRFLRYPLDVTQNGAIVPFEGLSSIPHFNLPVMGQKTFIPSKATT